MRFAIFTVCTFLLLKRIDCQDIIFPNDDGTFTIPQSSTSRPISERLPIIKSEEKCSPTMKLYDIGDSNMTKVCDCLEGNVYFPDVDSCYEPYSQGPCPKNHYVYIHVNQNTPMCKNNSCEEKNFVVFEGACHEFKGQGGPCDEDKILYFNNETFQLECAVPSLVPFVIIDAPKRTCPKGSRRNRIGVCKLVL